MITNIHSNCLGTTSFDAKFPRMLKKQDFVVYPYGGEDVVTVQSDTRIGQINLDSGEVAMTPPSTSHSGFASLQAAILRKKVVRFKLSNEDIKGLCAAIKPADEKPQTKPVDVEGMMLVG